MKIKKIIVCFLVICISLLIVIIPLHRTNEGNISDNTIFYNDYDELWSVIENEYPFLYVAERVTGKDFQKIKKQYHDKLSEVQTADEFLNEIVVPCLNEFSYTGHITAITPERYHQLYSLWQSIMQNQNISVPSIHNWEVLTSPEVCKFYGTTHIDNLQATIEKKNTLPFNPDSISNNLEFEIYAENSAAYISIKSMTAIDENNDDVILEQFFKWIEENGYEHCIIDIEENGGGSDSYWMLNIVTPNLKEALSYQYYAFIKGEQSQQYVSSSNYPIYSISDFPKSKFPNLNMEDYQDADYYTVRTVSSDDMGRDINAPYKPLFDGEFWLIVGPKTYSSSDSFAQFCKETGFAKLVGLPTGGDGMGLSPMLTSLSNTGICIQFSALGCLNSDGSNNEEVGTEPDFLRPNDMSALTYCLNIISQLENV